MKTPMAKFELYWYRILCSGQVILLIVGSFRPAQGEIWLTCLVSLLSGFTVLVLWFYLRWIVNAIQRNLDSKRL